MKTRARHEAEQSIIARRSGIGTAQGASPELELAKLQSYRKTCGVMEKMLKARFEEQRKSVEQSSGDAVDLTFKRDEVARAEKVFELIAQRKLQLETEKDAPARVALWQRAEAPAAPVELFPYKQIALAVLASLCMPFGLAVLWERLVGRVGDSQSLEQQSNLAVLGEITRLPVRKAMPRDSARIRIGYDIRLFEESIDSLRTSLTLSEDLIGMRVLAVTRRPIKRERPAWRRSWR